MARRLARPVRDFLRVEAAGGVVLLAATVAALIVANTPAGDDVAAFWEEPMTLLRIGEVDLTETVRHWVDDGLMAIFFIDAIAVIALEEARPVAERMQHLLHPWSSFVILPLFAFANAGIELSADGIADAATSPVTIGVVVGLVLGKPLGILVASWLAVRAGVGVMPTGVSWSHLLAPARSPASGSRSRCSSRTLRSTTPRCCRRPGSAYWRRR